MTPLVVKGVFHIEMNKIYHCSDYFDLPSALAIQNTAGLIHYYPSDILVVFSSTVHNRLRSF